MWEVVLVAAGGFLGANARFICSNWFARRFGTAFPYGTFFINLSGSFLLGLFLTLATRSILPDPAYRALIAVGFCGGYTTFSTYTYETLTLLREGRIARAWMSNLLGSYLVGVIAALAGVALGNLV
ncbi:MAG TPA: fluoride efflux transporter CrcB [Chloroflexia bacterium]|nr:fluoride efflux transporter CrcB [Chloroflexia bacterium]